MKSDLLSKKTPSRHGQLYQRWWMLYLYRHIQALVTAVDRLSRTPISTFMTVAVIGISLALPMGLYLLLEKAEAVTEGWRSGTRISLFLKMDISVNQANQLVDYLKTDPKIAQIEKITPQQALEEFQNVAGFEDVSKHLSINPFPTVLQIQPAKKLTSAEDLSRLVAHLQSLPEIDIAQLDIDWVKRLSLIIEVIQRAVEALAVILGIGVILIVGNMIRLTSENYREELEIAKLVGATNAFVRRPFLYTGALYGIIGGILAWLCIDFVILWLHLPMTELVSLYNSQVEIGELGFSSVLMLLGFGIGLGLIGAIFAVRHFLRQHEVEF